MIRKIFFISIFVLAFIASVAFAAFNTQAVTLSLYFGEWQLPLAVLLIAVLLIGLIIGAAIIFLSTLRLRLANRRLQHKLQIAEQELDSLRILPIRDNP
ncbi:MAG: lipopolysaccharide assembly protein LapA domain-containing protein [Methylophaga sp.]